MPTLTGKLLSSLGSVVLTVVKSFFKKPDYDVNVVQYVDQTKQPFAITEFLTVNAIDLAPTAFKGVAMVIAGQYDFIFCQSQ